MSKDAASKELFKNRFQKFQKMIFFAKFYKTIVSFLYIFVNFIHICRNMENPGKSKFVISFLSGVIVLPIFIKKKIKKVLTLYELGDIVFIVRWTTQKKSNKICKLHR